MQFLVISKNLNAGIFQPLFDWFTAFLALFGRAVYHVLIGGVGRVADICQLIFRKFAGISENGVQINGVQTNGDIVYTFLQSSIVRNLFFALLILAVIILLIATFTAVIKTEFAKDGNNNKRKVIKNAFRGLANFFFVPLICLFGVFMGNAILRAIDGATSTGAQMLSSQVFIAGAYNGNRMRMSEMNSGDQRYKTGSFGAFVAGTTGTDVNGYSNFGYFLDDTTGLNPQRAADKIDKAFAQGKAIVVGKGLISSTDYDSNESKSGATQQFDSPSLNSRTIYYEGTSGMESEGHGMWYGGFFLDNLGIDYISENSSKSTSAKNKLVLNEGDVIKFSIYNVGLVYYYYDLSFAGFNYLIGGIAMCFCAWTLLVTVLGLIKRIFMLSTLFIISAPVCAIYPLDEGKALGTWRGDFIKETLSAYAVVVVMNIFLALLPLIQSITLFIGTELGILQGFANYMAQVLIVIAGLSFFKDATKTISNIIGAGNAYETGDGVKKAFNSNVSKAIAGGKFVAGTAATVGKGIGKVAGVTGKAIGSGVSKLKDNSFKKAHEAEALAKLETAGVTDNNNQKTGVSANNSMNNKTDIPLDKNGNIDWHAYRLGEKAKQKYQKGEKKHQDRVEKARAKYESEKTSGKSGKLHDSRMERYESKMNQSYDDYLAKKEAIKEKRKNAVGTVKNTIKTGLKIGENFSGGGLDAIKGVMQGNLKYKDAKNWMKGSRGTQKKAKEAADNAKSKAAEQKKIADEHAFQESLFQKYNSDKKK